MGQLGKFISLPWNDKTLFFKAIALSIIVKVIVFALPIRWYSRYLDQSGRIFKTPENLEDLTSRVTLAVSRSNRYSPWSSKCLVDAITAKLLLQWKGINSTLYLGINKDKDKKLIAHAWLKCGEKFITGKKGFQKFTVVSSFS